MKANFNEETIEALFIVIEEFETITTGMKKRKFENGK